MTQSRLDEVRRDLIAEQKSLDEVVAGIGDNQWCLATASPGWCVADQIGHLTYFDGTAAVAIDDPDAFRAGLDELIVLASRLGIDEVTLGAFRELAPADQLAEWRANRSTLAQSAATLREGTRVAWYGPSMSAASFLSARLMETWAHGTDVAGALGRHLPATSRLHHIVQIGYLTRRWSYSVHGEAPPAGRVRVEVESPDGETWRFGDDDADDVVRGPAEDFCLVVTQRRHLDDTKLTTGELGRHWLLRAQAFAGGPSTGPEPRQP